MSPREHSPSGAPGGEHGMDRRHPDPGGEHGMGRGRPDPSGEHGMGRGPGGAGPLETRYRRLLRWYPADHRARHGEEMVGVLMAGAEPGRRLPDLRDALDLVRGGIAVRARRFVGPESVPHWRDALNVAAVLAPLYLLVINLSLSAIPLAVMTLSSEWAVDARSLLSLAWHLAYALVLGLALAGSRRLAVACAWIWALGGIAMNVTATASLVEEMGPGVFPGGVPGIADHALNASPGLLVALLLTVAPSPRAGLDLIGWRVLLRWAVACTAALAAAAVLPHVLVEASGEWAPEDYLDVIVAPTLIAMAWGAGSRTPAGLRAGVLLAPLVLLMYGGDPVRYAMEGRWPVALLQMLLVAVVFTVARRGFAPYGSGTAGSPERIA
ncbi:hypothetical protein ACFFMN_05370 [Planobispora siamensis]|uniref:Uncharacterized protein n=1 Tax=Planobispora siamensis TaxID=936338 RepID=A0A8J3SL44_9ACTN|nr:hypothetical protein [Planobispora siamensis]GIH94390.1 hypothetical protein Psi01_50200 [Planobispora siamensis]